MKSYTIHDCYRLYSISLSLPCKRREAPVTQSQIWASKKQTLKQQQTKVAIVSKTPYLILFPRDKAAGRPAGETSFSPASCRRILKHTHVAHFPSNGVIFRGTIFNFLTSFSIRYYVRLFFSRTKLYFSDKELGPS